MEKLDHKITLITGGARSGKSRMALSLSYGPEAKLFLATAEPRDEEMKERIQQHRMERGVGWIDHCSNGYGGHENSDSTCIELS